MSLEDFKLLRNIGQFDSVNAGASLPLAKLALIYAENGRGKTTLAAILRSVSANDPSLVRDRRRLGSAHPPHIVLTLAGKPIIYQAGAWSEGISRLVVFDDAFVAANVCSGIEIETAHRQNLHEFILGAQGVALNAAVKVHVDTIEVHNRELRQREGAIPASARGALNIDQFCALAPRQDVDDAIAAAERSVSAGQAADAIRQRAEFAPLSLPDFDLDHISGRLAKTLPELEAEAAARVQAHMRKLGRGGEGWIADGMGRIIRTEPTGKEECPFCAQDLSGSELIPHYQSYFSDAYRGLKDAINQTGKSVNAEHGGEIPAAFERAVRLAVEAREFWRAFTDIPDLQIDTAAIMRAWTAARDAVLNVLRIKAAAPLEAATLPEATLALVASYRAHRAAVTDLSAKLQACNKQVAAVKERAAAANVATLQADLARLMMVKARHAEPLAPLCQSYLDEKAAKAKTEKLRQQARDALDNYRQNIFPAYETAINEYLNRFNAGFRIGSVTSVNNRGGSSCTYNVVINNVPVSLTANDGPCFRNTLSAGDRNTLALAFFFASLDRDPQLEHKVVVIDDPMTSLDEHRSLATVQEMLKVLGLVSQVIVLSHSKPFLCKLWEAADKDQRSAMLLHRLGAGSTFAPWDVNQDCITQHDRNYELVTRYIEAGNPAIERQVAAALRPILEAFMRVAYPAAFPPGTLLGPFIGICQQRLGTPGQILEHADMTELRALLDYANRFHHDTNKAFETESINGQELLNFAMRSLRFARRP